MLRPHKRGHTPRVLPRQAHCEARGASAPVTSNDPNPDRLKQPKAKYLHMMNSKIKTLKNIEVAIIIPVLNEEEAIVKVLEDLPEHRRQLVLVVDNGSLDKSMEVARKAGAKVLFEPQKGYGRACLKGLKWLKANDIKPQIVVFLDGDYSDFPAEIELLLEPLLSRNFDFVLGSRTIKKESRRALTPQARFGNLLATRLIDLIWGFSYSDLGPFRALDYSLLKNLKMDDKTYGWTVQMQIRALQSQARILEIPVSYRYRMGQSKISGTIKGTILAGYKILSTIWFERKRRF